MTTTSLLLDEYQRWARNQGLSQKTLEQYLYSLKRLERAASLHNGDEPPNENSVLAFLDGLADQGNKGSSINRHLAAVKSYFSFMERPLGRMKRRKAIRPRPNFLSYEETNALAQACDRLPSGLLEQRRARALLMLLYDTALRSFEAVCLRVRDVIRDGFVTVEGKGGRVDDVPISDEAIEAISAYSQMLNGATYLFPSSHGGHLTTGWARDTIAALCRQAGLKRVGCHALRHSRATHLANAGVRIEDISQLLRHSRLETTMIYRHVMPAELRKKIPGGGLT